MPEISTIQIPLVITLIIMVNRFGPLVRFWCMRFEGKHNYFKDLAHRLKCFKNVSKSMSHYHQRLVCYYVNSSNLSSPFVKENSTGCGKGILHSYNYYYTYIEKGKGSLPPSLFATLQRFTHPQPHEVYHQHYSYGVQRCHYMIFNCLHTSL